jgi:hypothetical protein
MTKTIRTATLAFAAAAIFFAGSAHAAPPTITALTVDPSTGNVIITGTCTATVSGTAQIKVHFVDASGASHPVKKVNCPGSGVGTTKVKPPFIDLATSTPLPSGTYQVCLKQLGTTGCWATPISF